MKILFVCLGNICRSPTAEGVFRALVKKEGLLSDIEIDSAGTSACHVGERADSRMRQHALARGYDLDSISRKFDRNKDFDYFDKIIVMDLSNKNEIIDQCSNNHFSEKVILLTDYCKKQNYDHVPDPYYGGEKGFEVVIDIVEDACLGLLSAVKKDLSNRK